MRFHRVMDIILSTRTLLAGLLCLVLWLAIEWTWAAIATVALTILIGMMEIVEAKQTADEEEAADEEERRARREFERQRAEREAIEGENDDGPSDKK